MAGFDTTMVIGGRGLIFYDEPYASGNALPADSVYGTAWGGNWVNRGYTNDGLRVNWRRQFVEWDVDQTPFPVLRTPDTFDFRFGANLRQFDVSALKAATQQGTVTTGATSNIYAVSDQVSVAYVTVGYDVMNPSVTNLAGTSQEAVRAMAKRAIPVGDMNLGFTPRPPGPQINYEVALTPDTTSTPSQVAEFRYLLPQ